MNKQGNGYTIIYIIGLAIITGTILAITSIALKPKQQANADADKMRQILASVHVGVAPGSEYSQFEKYITDQIVVDSEGKEIGTDAFNVDVAKESKITDIDERRLPVFVCTLSENDVKYIIPVYGSGLWGPLWGYVSINSDGKTIYGAYFAHQGETPGLGAEIENNYFSDQFKGKRLFVDGDFKSIAVVKIGQKPLNGEDYVDGISGGTITSKGVGTMLSNCLKPYKAFLEHLNN